MEIDWASVVREFGLPLAILVAFGFLIITGKLRTEREVTEVTEELKAVRKARDAREEHMRREMETAVASWRSLYEQERNDRIRAQEEVRENIDALRVAFTVIDKLEQSRKP